MRPLQRIAHLSLALLAMSAMPLHAARTTAVPSAPTPPLSVLPQRLDDTTAVTILQSLRNDVAQHPSAYVTFETETAAHQFFLQHPDACRETDRVMMTRGIVGYWRGRTLAVIPSLAVHDLFHSSL